MKPFKIFSQIQIKFTFLILFILYSGFSGPASSDVSEKVIRICDLKNDGPVKLDPHLQFEEKNDNICNQIFETLLRLDGSGRPAPYLATSWHRISDTEMHFTLRPGVYFHNGEPFDARAVKFSLERNIAREKNFPSAHMIDSILSIKVLTPLSFIITTKHPDGILLHRLSGFGYIVPPDYIAEVGEKAFQERPVGTGPFLFSKWIPGKKLILTANPNYWDKALPKINRLEFHFAGMQERLEMFLNNKLDFITDFEPSQTIVIAEDPGNKIVKMPSWTSLCLNFNLRKKGPFQNRKVRQAINYGVNVKNLIRYVTRGNAKQIATLSMPGEFGFHPELTPYPYDIEKAKKLLGEAGYSNGFDCTVLIDDIQGGEEGTLAKVLGVQFAKMGIRAKMRGGNGTKEIVKSQIKGNIPEPDIYGLLCADPMGHILFIQGKVFYYKDSPFSLMNDPKLNDLYNRIITMNDLTEQERLCRKLEELIHDSAYSIFTYQQIKLYAMKQNIRYSPSTSSLLFFENIEITD